MSLNWEALVTTGRAKAHNVPWSPTELEALITLSKERALTFVEAADQLRNGILTVEDYDKALKKGFVPTKLDDAVDSAIVNMKDIGAAVLKGKGKRKTK